MRDMDASVEVLAADAAGHQRQTHAFDQAAMRKKVDKPNKLQPHGLTEADAFHLYETMVSLKQQAKEDAKQTTHSFPDGSALSGWQLEVKWRVVGHNADIKATELGTGRVWRSLSSLRERIGLPPLPPPSSSRAAQIPQASSPVATTPPNCDATASDPGTLVQEVFCHDGKCEFGLTSDQCELRTTFSSEIVNKRVLVWWDADTAWYLRGPEHESDQEANGALPSRTRPLLS